MVCLKRENLEIIFLSINSFMAKVHATGIKRKGLLQETRATKLSQL